MPTKDPNYNPHWAKITFDEFIAYWFGKADEEIVDDIRRSIEDLENLNQNGRSFGALMVRKSMARIAKNREARVTNCKKRSSGNSEKPNSLPAKLPEQLTYGARENVYLTQDQFNDLAAKVGNMNEARDLIDNLSYKLAEGSHKSNDHFATLCYWNECRKAKTTEQEPRKESQMERNFRIANEAMERIAKGETPRWRP